MIRTVCVIVFGLMACSCEVSHGPYCEDLGGRFNGKTCICEEDGGHWVNDICEHRSDH